MHRAQHGIVIHCDSAMADCAGCYRTILSIVQFQALDFNQMSGFSRRGIELKTLFNIAEAPLFFFLNFDVCVI